MAQMDTQDQFGFLPGDQFDPSQFLQVPGAGDGTDLSPIYLDPRAGNPSSLPGGQPINTALSDTQGQPDGMVTAPDPTTQTIPDPTAAASVPRQRTLGPPVDPATGQPDLTGNLTGPAPTQTPTPTPSPSGGPDYSGLDNLLTQLLTAQSQNSAASAAQRASLTQTLNGVIANAQRPVSATDPEIAGPTSAFNAQGQRARALMQEQLAQQAAATGRTTGSVDADVSKSFEDLGNATGSFEGNLMTNELASRRTQLQGALATAAAMGDSATAASIQEELGLLNDKIAAQGQQNQNTQFYDQLTTGMGQNANSLDAILAAMIAQGGGSLAA